jgi:hypothetical protein
MDGSGLKVIGDINTPGRAHDVAVEDGFAYVADKYGGLQVIDARDPTSPRIVGAVDTPGSASDITVADGLAFR